MEDNLATEEKREIIASWLRFCQEEFERGGCRQGTHLQECAHLKKVGREKTSSSPVEGRVSCQFAAAITGGDTVPSLKKSDSKEKFHALRKDHKYKGQKKRQNVPGPSRANKKGNVLLHWPREKKTKRFNGNHGRPRKKWARECAGQHLLPPHAAQNGRVVPNGNISKGGEERYPYSH